MSWKSAVYLDREEFTCENCGTTLGDVRLVEHRYDDVALCKKCFRSITADIDQEVGQ